MKKSFIFLCVVLETAVAQSDDSSVCNTWPSKLKTVAECCNIPGHGNDALQNLCYSRYAHSNDHQEDTIMSCYVNMTGIIKDGAINKNSVRRIYNANNYQNKMWMKIIADGVETCEFESSGSLNEDIVKYYNCVDDYLADHCQTYLDDDECDLTEAHLVECGKIQLNCTSWPMQLIYPESCCQTPQLISPDLRGNCYTSCSRKEFFVEKLQKCIFNCTFVDTGLITDGKFNFEAAKKVLLANTNNSEIWEKPVNDAVDACVMSAKGNETTE